MSRPADLRLTVFLRFFTSGRTAGSWRKDQARVEALLAALFSHSLFARLTHGRKDDDRFAVLSASSAAKLNSTRGEVLVELTDGDDDPEVSASLDLRSERVEVRATVRGTPLALRGDRALDDLIGVVQGIVVALADVAGLSDGHVQADFTGRAFDFPRSRPPRENLRYPERSLVTFIDSAFHASGAAFSRPGDPRALSTPPPPAPAKLSTAAGVTTVRFARSLDEAEILRAASAHFQWIVDRIDTDVCFGFNAEGDQLEERGPTTPMAPLTLYDREYHVGYKAIVVFPDGTYEREGWEAAKRIVELGCLTDGTVVTAVKLVVPLREHVALIAQAARAAGFDAVLYGTADGSFWDPNPPGNWRGVPKAKGAKKATRGKRGG